MKVYNTQKKQRGLRVGIGLLLLVVASASGYGVYAWQSAVRTAEQKESHDAQAALRHQVDQLQQQVNKLTTEDQTADTEGIDKLTAETAKQIVENSQWKDLEELLAAETVEIIVAASEGLGRRSPGQMINDLAVLDRAAGPWNFDLSKEILSSYSAGSYQQYFSGSSVVGRSSNGQIVSFLVDKNNEIKTIFIATSDEVLR